MNNNFGKTVNTPVLLTKCSNVPQLRRVPEGYTVVKVEGYMLFSYNYDFDIWVQGKTGNYQVNIGGMLTGLKYRNLNDLKNNVENDIEKLANYSKNRVFYFYMADMTCERLLEKGETVSSQKYSAIQRMLQKEAERRANKWENLY